MLAGAVDVLSDGERARCPRSLAIEAYFDGWSQASGGGARMFPRFLTRDEEESWRDGWREATAERAAWGDSRVIHHLAPVLTLPSSARPECGSCVLTAMREAA